MFAQLLITALLTWGLAEMLCRMVLGSSAKGALLDLLGAGTSDEADQQPEPEVLPHADLRRLLEQRQEELHQARLRLELTARASGLTADLATVEEELARVEERLAELEGQRRSSHRARS